MCRPTDTHGGTFAAALTFAVLVFALRAAWWSVKHFAIGLYVIAVWATPRLWRLSVRTVRAVQAYRRRRRMAAQRRPQLAIAAAPHSDLRWSTLTKETTR